MKTEINLVTLQTGEQVEVTTDLRDWIAWDMTRQAARWPAAQDAPILHRSYLVWSAMRRADPGSVAAKFTAEDAPTAIEIIGATEPDPTSPAAPGD